MAKTAYAEAASTVKHQATVDKIHKIMDEQNLIFVDRQEEIRILWVAALAGQHVFLIGDPGTSKSMLIRDIARRIVGANFYATLMRKETTVAELFGPLSLSALKQDRYSHNLEGHLATAHIALLDELFKASSAALNSTLTALNERLFKNGADEIKLPLITAFAASNEFPQGEELAAIYDRFLLRMRVRDVESDSDFLSLLVREPSLNSAGYSTISLAQFGELREQVKRVEIPIVVKEKLVELRSEVRTKANVTFGPRRWVEALSIVRAYAALDGRDVVDVDDLSVYQHILWDTEEERNRVGKVILSVVNPLSEKLMGLIDMAEQKYQAVKIMIESGKDTEATTLSVQANVAFKAIKKELLELQKQTAASNMQARIKQALLKLQDQHRYVLQHGLNTEV